eukprot:comp22045_c1_seq1/m.32036 comp22045_c1_seq1/g.32036  ORF comp22045_c1_seq1/g.32036 comp22045_c1_seq1/m.32036 type:complete len:176 (-) comp22045_c1_seq1:24-551(-)
MFFQVEMTHDLVLAPQYFGPRLRKIIKAKLHSEVEGTCSGRYGFVIAVTKINEIGLGKIMETKGLVTFPIKYSAIVFRPFKNEVLDAVVTQVTKAGIFCQCGPLRTFISKGNAWSDAVYDPNANPPCLRSESNGLAVQLDDEIRIKIIGTRIDFTEIFAVGQLLRVQDTYLKMTT